MEGALLTWRQRIGMSAEQAAAGFLQAQGAQILLRNYRCRCGELDIIARIGADELIIAEVRTRSSDAYGGAAASVDGGKRQRLIRAASQAWPVGGPARGRLFAFGFDAYRIAAAFRESRTPSSLDLSGLTGQLTLDPDGHVHRQLMWAQLHGGEVTALPSAPGGG